MSRLRLNLWCAACWVALRNGFGGPSMGLSIQAQLPALGQAQLGASLTGEQP